MVDANSLLPIFLLSSSLFLLSSCAAAEAVDPRRPQELQALFRIKEEEIKHEVERTTCSYTVKIKTSCYSPRFTSDKISLAFGDAYGNEVYAARLDDPSRAVFERCSTDTFKIQGPCGYGTCYLYLQRNGWDGWIPEWVKVYEPYSSRALTFYYGSPLPGGIWYGFNQCGRYHISNSGLASTT